MANIKQNQLAAAPLPIDPNTFLMNGQTGGSGNQQKVLAKDLGFATVSDIKLSLRGAGTGVINSYTGITANADTTLFDLGRVTGQIIDSTTDPDNPTVTLIDRPASTGHLTPYLATSNVTHVAVDSSGNIAYFASPLTNSQHRDYLYIGLVAHLNLANISVIVNEPTLCFNTSIASQDNMRNMGTQNLKDGNSYSGNSGSLTLAKTLGWLYASGINAFVDKKDPDVRAIAAETTVQDILKVFSDNTNEPFTGTNNEILNADVWEDIGGVGAGLANEQTVPSNKWTNQLIVMFQEGRTNIQVGQKLYASKAEAIADIGSSGYIVAPVIKELAVQLAVLTIKVGTTDFSDPSLYQITQAPTPHGVRL